MSLKTYTNHARYRHIHRLNDTDITPGDVDRHIRNGKEIMYAKRISGTKSLVYIIINENVVKLILNRKTKKIISILPFKEQFKKTFRFKSQKFNGEYIVEIYPDVYKSTKSKSAFTRIQMIGANGKSSTIAHNHPYFDELFKTAWKFYKAMKEGILNEKINQIKIKNEVIKIECEQESDDSNERSILEFDKRNVQSERYPN
jgi:hypothetical protein